MFVIGGSGRVGSQKNGHVDISGLGQSLCCHEVQSSPVGDVVNLTFRYFSFLVETTMVGRVLMFLRPVQ